MKSVKLSLISLGAIIVLTACGSKPEKTGVNEAPRAASPTEAPASQPAAAPQPQQNASAPAGSTTPTAQTPAAQPPAPPPPPAKPPEPKKYVVAAGTPISVRTLTGVSTKSAQSGSEFEATLENALVVQGHTIAKKGASVAGRVVNADEGGRVKGKASLTLALARLQLANGQSVSIQTNSVAQEAKSGSRQEREEDRHRHRRGCRYWSNRGWWQGRRDRRWHWCRCRPGNKRGNAWPRGGDTC